MADIQDVQVNNEIHSHLFKGQWILGQAAIRKI